MDVETENESVSCHSSDGGSGDSQVHDRRTSRFTLNSLITLLRFLAFMEKQPEHYVWKDINAWNFTSIAFWLVLEPAVGAVILMCVLASYGVFGFLVGFVSLAILTLEVPHCIWDR